MTKSYSNLMNSQFFTPAFNSAIFDGPIRIYFAQFNESIALKLYFNFQDRFEDQLQEIKNTSRNLGRNLFVLMYPNLETFHMSFPNCENMAFDKLNDDDVLGLCGPFEDLQFDDVLDQIADIIKCWPRATHLQDPSSELTPGPTSP